MHLSEYNTIAIGASRHHMLSAITYNSNQIVCFNGNENIASYRISMIIDREFNRRHNINQLIQRIVESGLFSKWYSEHTRNWFDPSVNLGTLNVRVEQIVGPVVFDLAFGWILGLLCLIAENIIHSKLRDNNNASRIWTHLEHFFDGKRHYFKNLPECLQASRE